MDETTANKITLKVEVMQFASRLAQVFGQKEAARMLRDAAKTVAPEKAAK